MDEKKLDFRKTVYELCRGDDEIKRILAEIGFTDILKPGMLHTAGRFMTVPKGAVMKNIDMDKIKQVFISYGYEIENY